MSNPFAAIQKFFTRPSYSQVIQANLALQGRVSALLEWRKELEERCNRFFLEARAAEVEVERLRALVPLEPAAAAAAPLKPRTDGQCNPSPLGEQPVPFPATNKELEQLYRQKASEQLQPMADALTALESPGALINPPNISAGQKLILGGIVRELQKPEKMGSAIGPEYAHFRTPVIKGFTFVEPTKAIGAFCPPAEDTFQDDMEKASVPPPRRRRLGILRKTTKTPKGKK